MSKFRALIVSALLATVVAGGSAAATGSMDAKQVTRAPSAKTGDILCC